MQQSWRSLFLITLPLAILGSLGSITLVRAQITPDNTLGAESSVVNRNVDVGKGIPSDRIDGGARRGANLFHSFQEFNIQAERGTYFSNPNGVANIITRVTGGTKSDIQGTLGVVNKNIPTNLFFINPNGINFGKNARLDLSGSFLASTANSLMFDNFEFSATNPQAPPLLNVNIPIGLRFRDNPGEISVQGSGQNLWFYGTSSSFVNPTLAVPAGQNLALVGGNVSLDGGVLQAPGGRVELGGLTAAGVVNLNTDGSLSFPQGVQRADVSLTNQAGINVIADQQGGGSININARNIDISGESLLTAAIARDLGTVNTPARDITLNATGETKIAQSRIENNVNSGTTVNNSGNIKITTSNLSLTSGAVLDTSTYGTGNAGSLIVDAPVQVSLDNSRVFSNVETGGIGKGGDINITTGSLLLTRSAVLDTSTFGTGNAGSVTINAPVQVSLDNSRVFSNVETGGIGKGGDINITTGSLLLTRSAVLDTSTFGTGNAGSVTINAPVRVSLDNSRVFSNVETGGIGKGGDINITTGSLEINNGAQLQTLVASAQGSSPGGRGNAGKVNLTARDLVSLDRGSILSNVGSGAVGNGANINIKVTNVTNGLLELKNGAEVNVRAGGGGSITFNAKKIDISGSQLQAGIDSEKGSPQSQAGDIVLNATGAVSVSNGSRLNASTDGQGNAGNVIIKAQDKVSIDENKSNNGISLVLDIVGQDAVGNAGDIIIHTGSLVIKNGAQLQTLVSSADNSGSVKHPGGRGNAGKVDITARDLVSLDGSSIFSIVGSGAVGNAGGINIKVTNGSLELANGAQLLASVYGSDQSKLASGGSGSAGEVSINAHNMVSLKGKSSNDLSSSIFTTLDNGATGKAGDIKITTGLLSLTDGALLRNDTSGKGDAGSININAHQLTLSSNASLEGDLNPGGIGKGADINLNVTGAITLDGSTSNTAPSGESTRITLGVLQGGKGSGGNLTIINTGSLVLKNGAIIKDSTQGPGDTGNIAGNITVKKADVVDISGSVSQSGLPSGLFTSTTNGKAGDITIKTQSFKISDGAALSARSTGGGKGGNITVNTSSFDAVNGGQLVTTASGQGNAGDIVIHATDRMTISGSDPDYNNRITKFPKNNPLIANDIQESNGRSGLFASTSGNAKGGDINITTGSLSLTNDARLSANTLGQGNAGNVTINTRELLVQDGAQVNASTTGQGNGGEVMINANALEIKGGGQILTTASNSGKAGDITVNASDRITLENTNSGVLANTTSSSTGEGGKITIKPQPNQLKFPDITIADGAQVAVDNQGTGKGGDISIQANTLTLNQGKLTASTNVNAGGNIMLNLRNYLLLRNKSQIFANAGESVAQGSGRGGNIKIDTPFIVSFPSKNYIFANSFNGQAGNITINATRYGIDPLTLTNVEKLLSTRDPRELQQKLTNSELPISAITAISTINPTLSGNIILNSPDVDPRRTIVELPQVVVDPVNKIAQNPCQHGAGSAFIVTGRGGLPPNPNEALSSNNVLVDLVEPISTSTHSPSASIKPLPTKPTVKRIVPAQGWVFNDKGEVVLTAYDPLGTGHQRTSTLPAACPAF